MDLDLVYGIMFLEWLVPAFHEAYVSKPIWAQDELQHCREFAVYGYKYEKEMKIF